MYQQKQLALRSEDDEPADENYCTRVLKMLVAGGNYAEAKDPEAWAKFMIAVLVGKPRRIVRGIVNPETGLVATCRYLPNVADLQEWLKGKLPKATVPEHRRFLPAPPEEEIPEEERIAGAEKLRELSDAIKAKRRQDEMRRYGIAPLPKQNDDPTKLADALQSALHASANALEGREQSE